MPIYMDRHFVKGATPRAIADAHEKDLLVQSQYGVRFLTYWFDEQRSMVFCLVSSPDERVVTQVHKDAHGEVANEIIEVDPATVEAFLGRVTDPPENGGHRGSVDSAFRAIMFTDLSDFTSTTVRLGDSAAMELLRIHNNLTREALSNFGGREVKHTGDGIMASFKLVPNAARCACAIQSSFSKHNVSNPDTRMQLRIGLSVGEPVEEHGDLFGSAVQLAARICSLAQPEQILLTDAVSDHLRETDLPLVGLGTKIAKGFDSPTLVHALDWRKVMG